MSQAIVVPIRLRAHTYVFIVTLLVDIIVRLVFNPVLLSVAALYGQEDALWYALSVFLACVFLRFLGHLTEEHKMSDVKWFFFWSILTGLLAEWVTIPVVQLLPRLP